MSSREEMPLDVLIVQVDAGETRVPGYDLSPDCFEGSLRLNEDILWWWMRLALEIVSPIRWPGAVISGSYYCHDMGNPPPRQFLLYPLQALGQAVRRQVAQSSKRSFPRRVGYGVLVVRSVCPRSQGKV